MIFSISITFCPRGKYQKQFVSPDFLSLSHQQSSHVFTCLHSCHRNSSRRCWRVGNQGATACLGGHPSPAPPVYAVRTSMVVHPIGNHGILPPGCNRNSQHPMETWEPCIGGRTYLRLVVVLPAGTHFFPSIRPKL